KTRTSTVLPPLGPEPSASTNSATWALQDAMIAHLLPSQRLSDAVGANYTSRLLCCKPLSAKKIILRTKLTDNRNSRFNKTHGKSLYG
ncbi:hypothetical protein NG726_07305, partial [Pseudomonas sp. MOB-449]|nr:hypothetical protein [Pseudomonas sp. MOB-449]